VRRQPPADLRRPAADAGRRPPVRDRGRGVDRGRRAVGRSPGRSVRAGLAFPGACQAPAVGKGLRCAVDRALDAARRGRTGHRVSALGQAPAAGQRDRRGCARPGRRNSLAVHPDLRRGPQGGALRGDGRSRVLARGPDCPEHQGVYAGRRPLPSGARTPTRRRRLAGAARLRGRRRGSVRGPLV
ncbi:MAG: hypothetical protein AVDCRST_MAG73-4124, partial [uncultured Thermomicrobiales bacterium]